VENRLQQPGNNRGDPRCDSRINSSKKVPKRHKYEGKCVQASWSVCLPPSSRAAAINRSVAEFPLLFILDVGGFSNMFTTYSHALWVFLASGLESRNQLQKRQEKNEFNFQLQQKNFLDWENEGTVSV
jgi:hypothetical protein